MAEVFVVLQLAIEIAFAVLAIRTAVAWVHQPDRRHGHLALAVGSLAAVVLLAPGLGADGVVAQAITDVVIVAFLISGYGLLMFRHTFVPFSRATTRGVTAAIVAIGLIDIIDQLPANPESPHSPLQTLSLVA